MVLIEQNIPANSTQHLQATAKPMNMDNNSLCGDFSSYRQSIIESIYTTMHTKQTIEFVLEQRANWLQLNKGEYTILEMMDVLGSLIDESDINSGLPSSIRGFQTAERIRQEWPEHDWFHLVGLLHDIGKVLACPTFAGNHTLDQWAVVGDKFVVGCKPSEDCAFGLSSFKNNPDLMNPIYGTEYGIYDPNCGISNLLMSWGSDEYMYWVLKENGCTMPDQGLNMIRFQSFRPWHTSRAYTHLEAPEDAETLNWVKEFSRFALDSKKDAVPDIQSLKPYYQSLLEKYNIGGKLRF